MKPLTEKQKELLDALLLGLPDKQIADRLGIKYPALRKRFSGLFMKFGVAGRTALAVAHTNALLARSLANENTTYTETPTGH